MKILHLLASPFFSGPAELVSQLALAQRALGHEVLVAVDRKRRHTGAEELAAPRLAALSLTSPEGLEVSVKSSPLAVLRDLRALKALEVDVMHCHFSHDHVLARFGRRPGTTLIRSIHAPRSVRRMLPKANGWTVPYETLSRAFLGQPVMVLPAIVDPRFAPPANRARLRTALGLPELPLVGMVSTFQASRRHDLGVSAFEQVLRRRPVARLALVGDGALLPQVKARVKTMRLTEQVFFPGYQSGEAFVQWLQALDEVWILGLGNDFSARAAAQARACGVRVVAVDEGALPRYADVVVERSAEGIAAKALESERRTVAIEPADAIARRVLDLYTRARA